MWRHEHGIHPLGLEKAVFWKRGLLEKGYHPGKTLHMQLFFLGKDPRPQEFGLTYIPTGNTYTFFSFRADDLN